MVWHREATREGDEAILRMVRWRCRGFGAGEIAKHLGVTSGYVRSATNEVRNADMRESGENITEGYWA